MGELKTNLKLNKMKKLALLIAMFIGIMNCELVKAQEWELDGNNAINPPTDFLGTTDNSPIPFFTDDEERMRLTPTGWLGINITAPDMMFHVDDGGILSTGTTGTNPDLGAGTRLMWIPDQAAFRAGIVNGTQWDGGNVGDGSVAFGDNNIASGTRSVAFGVNNEVTGNNSVAFADGNEVTGQNSLAFGATNTLTGANSLGLGASNEINNTGGVGIGVRNTIDGDFGVTIGRFLHSNAENAMVLGRGIDGSIFLENDIENSLMIGFNSTIPTVFVAELEANETFGSVGIGITDLQAKLDVAPDPDEDPDKPHGIRVMWSETDAQANDTDALYAEIRRITTSLRGRAV